MKIETRVVTFQQTHAQIENLTVRVQRAEAEGEYDGPSLHGGSLVQPLTREGWDALKKLGDAAWEAWDKTFGDKQPETMGVWRPMFEKAGYDDGRFVWYPGEKDFLGSAQKALDALRTEKPEWKLGLREYKVYKCATCQGCGYHLCEKLNHERCKGQTVACTRKSSSK